MVARAIEAADVGQEDFGRELGLTDYQLHRALARLPQDARYLLSRAYGVGVVPIPREQVMADMELSPLEFEKLHDEAIVRLRMVVGSIQPR